MADRFARPSLGHGHGGGWNNGGGGGWGNASGGGWSSGKGDSHGGDGGGGGSNNSGVDGGGKSDGSGWGSGSGRSSYAPLSGGSGSSSSSLSYDAGRNILKLDFKIGAAENHDHLDAALHKSDPEPHWLEPRSRGRHRHEHAASDDRDRYFHDQERRKLDGYLRNVLDGWKEGNSADTLNQSLNPMATSNTLAKQSQVVSTITSADLVQKSARRQPSW